MKHLFRKEINPYTVSCKAVFRNVDKTLTLYVRSDAPTLMINLKASEEKLRAVRKETDQEKIMEAVRFFAHAIFREEQGDRLIEFYNDPAAIITALNLFFDQVLKQKITQAQKK